MGKTPLFVCFNARLEHPRREALGCLCYAPVDGAMRIGLGSEIVHAGVEAAERWCANAFGRSGAESTATSHAHVEWVGWREEPCGMILGLNVGAAWPAGSVDKLGAEMSMAIAGAMARRGARLLGASAGAASAALAELARMARSQDEDAAAAAAPIQAWMEALVLADAVGDAACSKDRRWL